MGKYFCKPSDDTTEFNSSSPKDTELLDFDYLMGYGVNEKVKICKIVVLGESSTFKDQLIRQYQGSNNVAKHLEIDQQIYNLQVWDVPNHVFNIRNHSMANIYCQHATAAIIVIDTTNTDALQHAQSLILAVKDMNKDICVILMANKWKSSQRAFAEHDLEQFCKEVHCFIGWKKVHTEQEDDVLSREQMISHYDKTIKQMIARGIRSNNNEES